MRVSLSVPLAQEARPGCAGCKRHGPLKCPQGTGFDHIDGVAGDAFGESCLLILVSEGSRLGLPRLLHQCGVFQETENLGSKP